MRNPRSLTIPPFICAWQRLWPAKYRSKLTSKLGYLILSWSSSGPAWSLQSQLAETGADGLDWGIGWECFDLINIMHRRSWHPFFRDGCNNSFRLSLYSQILLQQAKRFCSGKSIIPLRRKKDRLCISHALLSIHSVQYWVYAHCTKLCTDQTTSGSGPLQLQQQGQCPSPSPYLLTDYW